MTRFAVLSLCVLLLLAGCGGGGAGDGTTVPTTTVGETTSVPMTSTTETTTSPTSTTTTTTDTPTTTTAQAGDLPADAGQRHVDALKDAESFTVETRLGFTNDSGNIFVSESRTLLDTAVDRGYRNNTVTFQTSPGTVVTQTYTSGDTTYERTAVMDSIQYRRASVPYDETGIEPITFDTVVGTVEENVTDPEVRFEERGTSTIDGVTVTRYEAVNEDLGELFEPDQFENATVTSADMNVYVDDSGIFRRFTFTLVLEAQDGEQITYDLEQTFRAVGSTTVPEPEWLDEAQQQTG